MAMPYLKMLVSQNKMTNVFLTVIYRRNEKNFLLTIFQKQKILFLYDHLTVQNFFSTRFRRSIKTSLNIFLSSVDILQQFIKHVHFL